MAFPFSGVMIVGELSQVSLSAVGMLSVLPGFPEAARGRTVEVSVATPSTHWDPSSPFVPLEAGGS